MARTDPQGYGRTVPLTWATALAWRMRRQLLEPVGRSTVADVVGRLTAVAAQLETATELAVSMRRRSHRPGDVATALADGSVIRTFAFRGATFLMTPEEAGSYLALRAASRQWELRSWQAHYGLAPSDWPPFREAVREALSEGPLTAQELGDAVTAHRRFHHLGFAFADGPGTLMKPLAWQGDMSFGPSRDGQATFQRLDGNPRWAGIPDLDTAGRTAIEDYFRAYGPATVDHVHYWLGNGLSAGRKRLTSWIADLGDRLAPVEVAGENLLVLAEDVDDLAGTTASPVTRLLPGFDQWVMGPGTSDEHVVPAGRRGLVSRQANIVIVGGVVSGTWSVAADELRVDWFAESAPPDRDAVAHEASRVGAILGRALDLSLRTV